MTANEKRQSFQKIIFSSSNCTFVASFQCYMLYALLVFLKSWIAAYSRVPAIWLSTSVKFQLSPDYRPINQDPDRQSGKPDGHYLSHPTDNMTAVRKAVYRWKLPCFQLSFLYSNIRFKRTSCWNHPPKSGEWIQYEKLTDATIKQNHYLYIQFDIMIGTENINRLKLVFVEEKENWRSSWKTCQLYQNGAPMFHGLIRLLFQGYWILTGRTYQ